MYARYSHRLWPGVSRAGSAIGGSQPIAGIAAVIRCASQLSFYRREHRFCLGQRISLQSRDRQGVVLASQMEPYLEGGNIAMRSPRKDPTQRSLPIGIATVPDAKDWLFD